MSIDQAWQEAPLCGEVWLARLVWNEGKCLISICCSLAESWIFFDNREALVWLE